MREVNTIADSAKMGNELQSTNMKQEIRIPLNLTFYLAKIEDGSTLVMESRIDVPRETEIAPEFQWTAQAGSKFVLSTAMRVVSLEFDWSVISWESKKMDVDLGRDRPDPGACLELDATTRPPRVMGLGAQFSHTDLVGKGEIPIWSQEQGVGRGVQPITYLLDKFVPFAGGDTFKSYSAIPAWVDRMGVTMTGERDSAMATGEDDSPKNACTRSSTASGGAVHQPPKAYGVVLTNREYATVEFDDEQESDSLNSGDVRPEKAEARSAVNKGARTKLVITYPQDYGAVEESRAHVFEARLSLPETGVASAVRNVNREIRSLARRADQLSPEYHDLVVGGSSESNSKDGGVVQGLADDENKITSAGPLKKARSLSDIKKDENINLPSWRLPKWTQEGAIIGSTGGASVVNAVLEKLHAAKVPVRAVWSQDWSGRIFTDFGTRVRWDWRLDESHYPNFREFSQKWLKRGVRVLTYVNSYVRSEEEGQKGGKAVSKAAEVKTPAAGPSATKTIYQEAVERGFFQKMYINNVDRSALKPKSSKTTPSKSLEDESTSTQEQIRLPSATDDFQFSVLALDRREVREWYVDVLLCNAMMLPVPERCPELSAGEAGPLVHGWMSDFGEYGPLGWVSVEDGTRSTSHKATLKDGDKKTAVRFALSGHTRYLEQWGEVTRMVVEKYSRLTGKRDVIFNFFRAAGLLNTQILGSFWMGDQTVTWDAYDGFQSAAIGATMSGFSGWRYVHADVGGYTMTDRTAFPGPDGGIVVLPALHRGAELMVRWMQYTAFADAVFRTHPGTKPGSSVQPWDDEILPHLRRWATVFARGAEYREKIDQDEPLLPLLRHGSLVDDSTEVWWEDVSEDEKQADSPTRTSSASTQLEFDANGELVHGETTLRQQEAELLPLQVRLSPQDKEAAKNCEVYSSVAAAQKAGIVLSPQLLQQLDAEPTTTSSIAKASGSPAPASTRSLGPSERFASEPQPCPPEWTEPTTSSSSRTDRSTKQVGEVPGRKVGEQQFFLGPELLIAPVFKPGQRKKRVFLPSVGRDVANPLGAAKWTQLWTGNEFAGGQFVTVAAPLEEATTFYRSDENAKYASLIRESYKQSPPSLEEEHQGSLAKKEVIAHA
ncbi:unnamed protein product [Amoebophrya sp. A25]|nr:unnamed protein product [Amoebophrya sp. A25]|eukprot:GSA25T00008942001.1